MHTAFLSIKNKTDLPEIRWDLSTYVLIPNLKTHRRGLPRAPDQQDRDRSACSGVWHASPISRVFGHTFLVACQQEHGKMHRHQQI
jgi:hypothetical protein